MGKFAQGIRPGFPTDQQILDFLDKLENEHLKKFEYKIHCNLSGGEPTLHPMFPIIVERLNPYGVIGVATNCSRSVSWWEKLSVLPTTVMISLHPKFSKIEKVNEVAFFLREKNTSFFFNLMCDPSNWQDTLDLYDKIDDHLKHKVIPRILNRADLPKDNREPRIYTDEQKRWMETIQCQYDSNKKPKRTLFDFSSTIYYENGETEKFNEISPLLKKGLNNHYNWKCSAGSRSISVNFDGNVWAGICKQQLLGKIDNFKFLDEFLTCSRIYCVCISDLLLDKYDPKFFQESI
jgi:organic radical activating enzyme